MATITGTTNDDILSGTAGDDVIFGEGVTWYDGFDPHVITSDSNGTLSDAGAWYISLSPDGTKAVFTTQSSNLASGHDAGSNGGLDIYLKDLVTGELTLLTMKPDGTEENGTYWFARPHFSADSQSLIFLSYSWAYDYVDPNDNDWIGPFQNVPTVLDLSTGERTYLLLEDGFDSIGDVRMSPDGNFLLVQSNSYVDWGNPDAPRWSRLDGGMFLKNLTTGEVSLIAEFGAGGSTFGAYADFSRDGENILFMSRSELLPGASPGLIHAYLYNMSSGEFTLLSADQNGAAWSSSSDRAVFLPDGSNVLIQTDESPSGFAIKNILTGSVNWDADAFLNNGHMWPGWIIGAGNYISDDGMTTLSYYGFTEGGNQYGTQTSDSRESVSDDILYGWGGNDDLNGYHGNDILDGGEGNDTIYGDQGLDWLFGGAGEDTLLGGTETDALFGGDDDDQLMGEDGGDSLDGGAGNDLMLGGRGVDWARGGLGNDRIYGDEEGDALFGEDGDDQLFGGDGDDSLDGGEGHDELVGGAGVDWLYGGLGDDVLAGGADGDALFGDAGTDSLFGDDGNDSLDGGDGQDVLSGGSGDDWLFGQAREDWLFGDEGSDVLFGGTHNDRLDGGAGGDSLDGGSGNDILIGGAGIDVLFGGSGFDRFRYYSPDEGGDVIRDFFAAEDGFQILSSNFGFGYTGALQSGDFTSGAGLPFDLESGAGPKFYFETETRGLWFDPTGGTTEDIVIVAGLETGVVTADDIVLV